MPMLRVLVQVLIYARWTANGRAIEWESSDLMNLQLGYESWGEREAHFSPKGSHTPETHSDSCDEILGPSGTGSFCPDGGTRRTEKALTHINICQEKRVPVFILEPKVVPPPYEKFITSGPPDSVWSAV